MGRSYLFPGRDTSSLTPQEKQLERLYDQIDTPNNRITPQQFFTSPQYGQWLTTNYGDLSQQVPPGSQIINQTPFKIEFKDADGYTHVITRQGADAASGQFQNQTDRPPILPNTAQQDYIAQLQKQLQAYNPNALPTLTPENQAQLQSMSDAERAAIAQQAQDVQGKLVAQLYGNHVNQSSIANDAAARFAQQLGLVYQQQQADAANRQLGLQQFLAQQGGQQNQSLASLLANLSGQQNQRDISSAGLGLDQQQLAEQMRQFNKNYGLGQIQLGQNQQQIDAANSPFNKFLKTLSAAGALGQGIGTAYRAIRG